LTLETFRGSNADFSGHPVTEFVSSPGISRSRQKFFSLGSSVDDARYLSIEQASEYTSLSISFIQKLTSRRRVPHVKVGRRCLYDKTLLDKWLQRRQVLPRDWAGAR
jgi:excisionase family DNA binding protein